MLRLQSKVKTSAIPDLESHRTTSTNTHNLMDLGSCRINIPPRSPSMSLVQSYRWVIDWMATIGESNGTYSPIMFLISA